MSTWLDAPRDINHGGSRRVPLRRPEPPPVPAKPAQISIEDLRAQLAALRGDDHFTRRERARLQEQITRREAALAMQVLRRESDGDQATTPQCTVPRAAHADGGGHRPMPRGNHVPEQEGAAVRRGDDHGRGLARSPMVVRDVRVDGEGQKEVADAPPTLVRQPPDGLAPIRPDVEGGRSDPGDGHRRPRRAGPATPARALAKGGGARERERAAHLDPDAVDPRSSKQIAAAAHNAELRAQITHLLRRRGPLPLREIADAIGLKLSATRDHLRGINAIKLGERNDTRWGLPGQVLRPEAPSPRVDPEPVLRRLFPEEADALLVALRGDGQPRRDAARRLLEAGMIPAQIARLAGATRGMISDWRRRGWIYTGPVAGLLAAQEKTKGLRASGDLKRSASRHGPAPDASSDPHRWLVARVGEEETQALAKTLRGPPSQARRDAARRVCGLGYGGGIVAAKLAGVQPVVVSKWKQQGFLAQKGIDPLTWLRRLLPEEADALATDLRSEDRRKAAARRIFEAAPGRGAKTMIAGLSGVTRQGITRWLGEGKRDAHQRY